MTGNGSSGARPRGSLPASQPESRRQGRKMGRQGVMSAEARDLNHIGTEPRKGKKVVRDNKDTDNGGSRNALGRKALKLMKSPFRRFAERAEAAERDRKSKAVELQTGVEMLAEMTETRAEDLRIDPGRMKQAHSTLTKRPGRGLRGPV